MESAHATFYLFDELVAEEGDLYDKRVKTPQSSDWDMGLSEKKKARGTNPEPRAVQLVRVIYRFLEPSLRRRATVGVSSVNWTAFFRKASTPAPHASVSKSSPDSIRIGVRRR